MKKHAFVTFVLLVSAPFFLSRCTQENPAVKPITYDEFIHEIWDFERHPTEYVFKGKTPAVVDFYSNSCRPCRQLSPIIEKLAEEFSGQVAFYKVNVEEEKALAKVFRIQGVPAVFFMPMEGRPMKQTGILPENEYRTIIEESLLHPTE